MKREDIQMEVDRNFKAFQEQLPDLVLREGGRFALMKSGECVDFFDTARDAQTAGRRLYRDGIFSIQAVSPEAVDLGWYSHALR